MKRAVNVSAEVKRKAVARLAAGEAALDVAADLKVDRRRLYEWQEQVRIDIRLALDVRRTGRRAHARDAENGEGGDKGAGPHVAIHLGSPVSKLLHAFTSCTERFLPDT